jgi:hypothetical protein
LQVVGEQEHQHQHHARKRNKQNDQETRHIDSSRAFRIVPDAAGKRCDRAYVIRRTVESDFA